jgi:hypothetical protein
MKKILLAAAILFTLNAGAQTIDMDGNGMFAEITPISIDWLDSNYRIVRVYVDPNHFAVNTTSGKGLVDYKWWLMYSDEKRTFYRTVTGPLGEGHVNAAGIANIDATLRQSTLGIFNYVSDSIGLSIEYK